MRVLYQDGQPEGYRDEANKIAGRIAVNNQKAMADEISIRDWRTVNAKQTAAKTTAGNIAFPDGTTPKGNKEKELLSSWYSIFDASTDRRGEIDGETLIGLQADWLTTNGQEAADFISRYSLLGKDPIAKNYTSAIKKMAADGYFKLPQIALEDRESNWSETDLLKLKLHATSIVSADPDLREWKKQSNAIYEVLSRESVPEEVINDIIHLGSSKWENPAITDYKAAHPGLMAWLRGNLNYSATLKLMEEEGLTPFK